MKKELLMLVVLFAFAANADAQGWLNRVKDKVMNKVENTVDNAIDKTIDKAADEATGAVKGKKGSESESAAEDGDDSPVAQNQKSDFVRGSVILFEDDFANEQMGEFPSKWDISEGSVEVASVNGK
ncbi:MAG: OmpA family protein, partial [Prevotella sp.]|nr:OmpA family protein [Prevotella sp.]